MRQNKNSLFYMGGSGLDRIQFYRIRTGLEVQNFSAHSSLKQSTGY